MGKLEYRPLLESSNYMILQGDLAYVSGAKTFGDFQGRSKLPSSMRPWFADYRRVYRWLLLLLHHYWAAPDCCSLGPCCPFLHALSLALPLPSWLG